MATEKDRLESSMTKTCEPCSPSVGFQYQPYKNEGCVAKGDFPSLFEALIRNE